MKVLVFVEQRDGKIKPSSKEAIAAAHQIAGSSAHIAALVVGAPGDALKDAGVDTIFTVNKPEFKLFNAMNYTAAAQKAVEEFKAEAVIGMASPMGRELFPRLAARLNGGLITDVTSLQAGSGTFKGGTKPMYAGKVLAQVEFKGPGIKLATVRPNSIQTTVSGGAGNVVELAVATADAKIKTLEIKKGSSDKPDLTEASRIISGGRSLGSADNFKIINECADALNATVGASRAAVDAGYAGHSMQVGQTGKTVSPQLYIACGISGAIQHMAGMRTSKVIVAINSDPEAPIFSVADYGIVADLFEAVPILTKKLKEVL
jgi:electron transfer flavoprotein alpha subunit